MNLLRDTAFLRSAWAALGIAFFSMICTFFAESNNFHNRLNLIWMVIIPVFISMFLSKSWMKRISISVIMILVSLISSTVFVFSFWGGY